MWEPNEIRVVRWFMRFVGVGLIVPGAIYLLSWPDTVRAFDACVGAGLAGVAAGLTASGSIFGGLTFLLARGARLGAIVAGLSLLAGAFVHLRWMTIMLDRASMLPEGLTESERAMLVDTIQFAGNAQMPHALKNVVLVGVCAMVYLLAPRLCGSRMQSP